MGLGLPHVPQLVFFYSKLISYTNLASAVFQIFPSVSLTYLPLNLWTLPPSSPVQKPRAAVLSQWKIITQKVHTSLEGHVVKVCFGETCVCVYHGWETHSASGHQPSTQPAAIITALGKCIILGVSCPSTLAPYRGWPCPYSPV